MPVKGIVTMCAPMTMRTTDIMYEGVLKYAREYKKYEGKTDEEIEKEVEALQQQDDAFTRRSYANLFMMSVIMSIIFMHHFSSFKDTR